MSCRINRKLDLSVKTPLITQAVVILAPEETMKIKGEGIEDAGVRDMQGVKYHMYNGPAMGPGSNLNLTISAGTSSGLLRLLPGSSTNLVVGLSAFGLVLVIAGAWLYSRTRRSEPVTDCSAGRSRTDACFGHPRSGHGCHSGSG